MERFEPIYFIGQGPKAQSARNYLRWKLLENNHVASENRMHSFYYYFPILEFRLRPFQYLPTNLLNYLAHFLVSKDHDLHQKVSTKISNRSFQSQLF